MTLKTRFSGSHEGRVSLHWSGLAVVGSRCWPGTSAASHAWFADNDVERRHAHCPGYDRTAVRDGWQTIQTAVIKQPFSLVLVRL